MKDFIDKPLNENEILHERSTKFRNFPIPTNDLQIKTMLRDICEPIIMFAESLNERRERLKAKLKQLIMMGVDISIPKQAEEKENIELTGKTFYIEAEFPDQLLNFRKKCLSKSIPMSLKAIDYEVKLKDTNRLEMIIKTNKNLKKTQFRLVNQTPILEHSFIGCSMSLDGSLISICGGGSEKNISVYKLKSNNNIDLKEDYLKQYMLFDELDLVCSIGDSSKYNCVKFNKKIYTNGPALAASAENFIYLSSLDLSKTKQLSCLLKGHTSKINKISFSAIDEYLGSVSNDKTFRIWDLPTKKNILTQHGHYDSITCLAFQRESALAVTCDANGIGLIWDLRSGKKVHLLEGHTHQITSCDFSSSYTVITGGDDNTLRSWDLRTKTHFVVPAHNKPICYVKQMDNFTVSASIDGKIRLWNNIDFSCFDELNGDGKINDCGISNNSDIIYSVSQKFCMWKIENN